MPEAGVSGLTAGLSGKTHLWVSSWLRVGLSTVQRIKACALEAAVSLGAAGYS